MLLEVIAVENFCDKMESLLKRADDKRIKYTHHLIIKENGNTIHKLQFKSSQKRLYEFVKESTDLLKKTTDNKIVVA